MGNTKVKRLSFKASLAAKLSSFVLLLLQLYAGLIFYNGIVANAKVGTIGFSKDVNVVERAKLIIEWFKNLAAGKNAIFPHLFFALHFVIFAIVAVNFVISFVRFFCLFGKKNRFLKNQKNSFSISKLFVVSSSWMLFFMLITSWVNGYELLDSAKLLIIVVSAGILISRLSRCVLAKTPFMTTLCQVIYSVVFFAVIGIIMTTFSCDVITIVEMNVDKIIDGGMKFRGVFVTALSACTHVLFGLITLNVLVMINSCKNNIAVPNDETKRAGITIVIYAVIAVVMIMLASNSFSISVLKMYAKILLSALSVFFFGFISPKIENENINEEDEYEEEEPEASEENPEEEEKDEEKKEEEKTPDFEFKPVPKIVFVGKKVLKIKANKYRYRDDINVLVIPKNVAYIEGYAFFGCTEIKEIHCERKEKPRFWHNQWNFGCPAKVIWDSTDVDNITYGEDEEEN